MIVEVVDGLRIGHCHQNGTGAAAIPAGELYMECTVSHLYLRKGGSGN
jgi:hypothetical protein